MADGASQRCSGMSAVEFCIAPKGAIDKDDIAGVVNVPQLVCHLGKRRRIRDTLPVGFQQNYNRSLPRLLCIQAVQIQPSCVVGKRTRKRYGSARHAAAGSKSLARTYLYPGKLV